jgi:hypothetical protein
MMKAALPVAVLTIFLTASPLASAAPFDPKFAIDPASPAIDGVITPDDALVRGPIIFTQGTQFGLLDDFFASSFDNLNSLSYGLDPVTPSNVRKGPVYFSVDRVAVGIPGSDVFVEARPGIEDAAGDVFQALPPVNSNDQIIDEEELRLTGGFFGDDLDALELDSNPDPWAYFSIDSQSASALTNRLDPTDILVSRADGNVGLYADGESMIGLRPNEFIDALALWDFRDGNLDPVGEAGEDFALFSVSTFSESVLSGQMSPAAIYYTDFSYDALSGAGGYRLWASPVEIGLRDGDELDALDVPEPGTALLLLIGAAGGFASKRWQRGWRPLAFLYCLP